MVVGRVDGPGVRKPTLGAWPAGVDWRHVVAGDFNGDGKTDLAGLHAASGRWHVLLGATTQPNDRTWPAARVLNDRATLRVGDFNQDGRDDVLALDSSTGTLQVGWSTGDSLRVATIQTSCRMGQASQLHVGDLNGDGCLDVLACDQRTGVLWLVTFEAETPAVTTSDSYQKRSNCSARAILIATAATTSSLKERRGGSGSVHAKPARWSFQNGAGRGAWREMNVRCWSASGWIAAKRRAAPLRRLSRRARNGNRDVSLNGRLANARASTARHTSDRLPWPSCRL